MAEFSISGPGRGSASTHWSRLFAAGEESPRAWEYFYDRYRAAVAVLFRRLGAAPSDLDDLVHEFFLHAFERGFLDRADPARGRFRGYLRTAAERFLASAWRKAGRRKRRPEGGLASLVDDELVREAQGRELAPDLAFDLAWARSALAAALSRTREALHLRGTPEQFEAFRLRTEDGQGWPQIADAVGTTPEAARKWSERTGDRVARYLREELGGTVSSPEELDREIDHLAEVLARETGGPR